VVLGPACPSSAGGGKGGQKRGVVSRVVHGRRNAKKEKGILMESSRAVTELPAIRETGSAIVLDSSRSRIGGRPCKSRDWVADIEEGEKKYQAKGEGEVDVGGGKKTEPTGKEKVVRFLRRTPEGIRQGIDPHPRRQSGLFRETRKRARKSARSRKRRRD